MTLSKHEPPSQRELLSEDFATYGRHWLNPGLHAMAMYRLGQYVHSGDSLGRRAARPAFRLVRAFVRNVYGIELPPEARIGRRLFLGHAHGVVFAEGAVVGNDCLVRHNVTLGSATRGGSGRPIIGDRVEFGPGSIVMGRVVVGDDVLIGPNAVVFRDVPAGSRVLAPAPMIRPATTRQPQPPAVAADSH